MIMKTLANIHPGEVLQEEFLKPMKISAYKLSKDIGIPQTRTSAILKGLRGITADTALRLSLYFGTSAKFWLGLQDDFDLEEIQKVKQDELKKIKKISNYAA
jgi:addiction module HigA family antidote